MDMKLCNYNISLCDVLDFNELHREAKKELIFFIIMMQFLSVVVRGCFAHEKAISNYILEFG